MKKVNVENAVGMELCHDITAMFDGFKGALFKRGHVIQESDIPRLLDIGKKTIFVWEDHAGEIHEEDAAKRMAAMTPVEQAHYTGPSEGKVLLFAETAGMFRVDTQLLKEINSIGDITIATLPDHYPVEKGARMASMRIVPLVTKEEQIIRAEKLCEGRKLLDLRPYQYRKIGVIITGSEVYTGRIQDKFEPVVRQKMTKYPCEILGVTICDDDLDMIVAAGQAYLEQGADFLIFTGGMSVDPDDLTPTAIRRLGADIISHGVPAQPGNMTLVAYLNDVAILGVPGAAISLPTTIFDVLLPQIFAGDKLTKEDLIKLADGGLCQMCGSAKCHFPNCSFGRY
ncbi:MAG: molybdopterin-binding protein [Lachnospiraceae bacterium]|nr:molybdopterin-binding protein [Lachnospiraceae bacterium]